MQKSMWLYLTEDHRFYEHILSTLNQMPDIFNEQAKSGSLLLVLASVITSDI